MTVVEATFSGVPGWLLAAYLVEQGGIQEGEATVRGDGWLATLATAKTRVGAVAIGRVIVRISGPRADQALAALRKKAQRGGG